MADRSDGVATIGRTMGQPIVVNEKPSSYPGVVRFETNRAITGMGHERYRAGTEVWGERPPDELARRLLAHGGIDGVQINANVVTVDLADGHDAVGLKSIIEDLYRFYPYEPATSGDNAVGDAPSADAAEAPEEAAVPADGTSATADDAPAPDHPTGAADAAETAPTDDPAPVADPVTEADPDVAAEPARTEADGPAEVEPVTEADPEVADAPSSDPEEATRPVPADSDGTTVPVTEADPEVADAPASDPEAATAPSPDELATTSDQS